MSTLHRKSTGGISRLPALLLLASSPLLLACPKAEPEPPGVDPTVRADPGEARAGIIPEGPEGEAALFGGIAAEGRAGDIKLYNHLVQFVIQDARPGHGYVSAGGYVLDADLVRAEGRPGRDLVDDMFQSFGVGRIVDADHVEIIADGSDGGPAIVRSHGKDVLWQFIQGALESDGPMFTALDLDVVTDLTLAPDSHDLIVDTTITNRGRELRELELTDGLISSSEDQELWATGRGMEGPSLQGRISAGATGRWGEPSMVLTAERGLLASIGMNELIGAVDLIAVGNEAVELAPGASATIRRTWTLAPDTAGATARAETARGVELGRLSGRITDSASGEGLPGVRVHFVATGNNERGAWAFAVSTADGRYSADLPAGEWLVVPVARVAMDITDLPAGASRYAPFGATSVNRLQLDLLSGAATAPAPAFERARMEPEPAAITLSAGAEESVDFMLDPPGVLSVELITPGGGLLPGTVDLLRAGDPSPVATEHHDALGLPSATAGRMWTADGRVSGEVLPGTYTLIASFSDRHERTVIADVVIESGGAAERTIVIPEAIPRDSWVAVDPHLHAAPSSDGRLSMEERVLLCAAAGVDVPITTDHDRQVSYSPLVEALGLSNRMLIIPGVEVSTTLRGHFNLFPVTPDASPNGGAEPWWFPPADTEELFTRMRSGEPDALVQVNHGRFPGLMSFGRYEPETGEPGRPELWSWDFELFELINGESLAETAEVRADWFSWLSIGRIKVPAGVSDSHGRSDPCGSARTDVFVDTDRFSEVTADLVLDNLAAGHVTVGSGVTLRVDLDGALPGDTLTGAAPELNLRVLGPTWAAPDTWRVYRNGDVVLEEALPAAPVAGVWLDTTRALPTDGADAWFVVEVEGGTALGGPYGGRRAYAASNAFFVDIAGDGWTPPGL